MKKIVSIKEVVSKEIRNSKNIMESMIKNSWNKIVGETLSKKSAPYFIKNSTLYVSVENSAWTQQMQFLKNDIIEKTNNFLNGAYISEILFKNSEIKRFSYVENKIENKNEIDTSEIKLTKLEESELNTISKEIENEEIREKFYKILVENKKREIFLMKDGYKRCERCLILFNGDGNVCYSCLSEEKQKREKETVQYIIRNPGTNFMKTKEKINRLLRDEFIELKKRAKDFVYREVMIYMREKKYKEAREKIKTYFMIELETENMDVIEQKADYFIENMKR
jgi:hypothetical protein